MTTRAKLIPTAMLFEHVIDEVKPFGPYQKRLCLLICLTGIPAALNTMIGVFTLATPEHRCAVPGLDNDTWASQGPWHDEMVKMTIPYDQELGGFSQCQYYADRNLTHRADGDNSTAECSRWVFSKEIFEETVISEMNLVCKGKEKITLANSILLGGKLGGSLILGSLSDVIGRKKIILIGLLGQFIVVLATAFVKSYPAFVGLRFMTTFFGKGFFLAAFVAGMELLGPAQRPIAGIVIEMFWAVGLFILLALAYLIRNWHYLQVAVACCNLFFVGHIFLLPESARWLASKGRIKEASVVIRKAAKVNKAQVSEKVLSLQDLQCEQGKKENICAFFRSPKLLLRSLIVFMNWFVDSMVYYGLGLNVGALSGDLYLNFLYASLAEGLSYLACLFFLYRVGRRPLYCFFMLLGGAACALIIFPVIFGDDSAQWVTVALSMIGKFGISAAYAIIYLFSAEVFPTMVRNSGLGASSVCSRIGGIASPYVADLGNYVSGDFGTALPSLIFGGLSVLAGVCALLLPETRDKLLPETIEDAKHIGRKPDKTNVYAMEPVEKLAEEPCQTEIKT